MGRGGELSRAGQGRNAKRGGARRSGAAAGRGGGQGRCTAERGTTILGGGGVGGVGGGVAPPAPPAPRVGAGGCAVRAAPPVEFAVRSAHSKRFVRFVCAQSMHLQMKWGTV